MPVKVDSAIIFAPAGELVPPALESLQKGGTLSLAGIYMTPIPAMDYQRYVFYERDIHSVTCNTRADGRELLAEAAAIPIRPHTTRLSAGRREPRASRPEARPDQRHGRVVDRINIANRILENANCKLQPVAPILEPMGHSPHKSFGKVW